MASYDDDRHEGDDGATAGVDPAFALSLLRTMLPNSDAAEPISDEARIDASCTIWDLSAEASAAAFMREHGLISLLLHPIANAQEFPSRLHEICAGIAANLCSVDCESRNELLFRRPAVATALCTLLLSTEDAPTIFELLRLLSTLAHHAAAAAPPSRDNDVASAEANARRHWLAALATPETLSALVMYMSSTLRADLQARAATLISTLLYIESSASASPGGSSDVPAVSAALLHIKAPYSIFSLVASQCSEVALAAASASSTPESEAALTALLQLLDGLASALPPRALLARPSEAGSPEQLGLDELSKALLGLAASVAGLALRAAAVTALATLVDHVDGEESGGESEAANGDGANGDSANGDSANGGGIGGSSSSSSSSRSPSSERRMQEVLLEPRLIVASLRLLRDSDPVLEAALEAAAEHDEVAGESAEAADTLEGMRAGWSLLHRCAASLDGFGLCLPSEGQALHSAAFGALLGHAKLLRRAVDSAVRRGGAGGDEGDGEGDVGNRGGCDGASASAIAHIARATVHALLEAANVVVTSSSCAAALSGLGPGMQLGGADGGEWVGRGVIGGSSAADFVLRALNVLRPSLAVGGAGDEEVDDGGDVQDDVEEEEEGLAEHGFGGGGFGDGLPGAGGAAWASSDEEEVEKGRDDV